MIRRPFACPRTRTKPRIVGYEGFGIGSRMSDVTRSTSRVRGPWTPSTRLSSMSEVAEGPEMNVIERAVSPAAVCKLATASGTSPTTWSSRMTHRCGQKAGKRDRSDIDRKRDDIVKLGGPADVRAIFTRARHFDFGPPFAGDPWDDRPTLGPNVSRFPSAIPAGQRGGLVARCGEALPVPARCRFD